MQRSARFIGAGVSVVLAAALLMSPAQGAQPAWFKGSLLFGGEVFVLPMDARDHQKPIWSMTKDRGPWGFDATLMHNTQTPALHGEGYRFYGDGMSFIDTRYKLSYDPALPFTLFACFRADGVVPRGALVGQRDLDNGNLGGVGLDVVAQRDGGLHLEFWLRDADGRRSAAMGSSNVLDARFHCAAGIMTGSALELWLDGSLEARAPLSFAPFTILPPLFLGCRADTLIGEDCFVGVLDEVRAYERVLGASELLRLQADPYDNVLVAVEPREGRPPGLAVNPSWMPHASMDASGPRVSPATLVWATTPLGEYGVAFPGWPAQVPRAVYSTQVEFVQALLTPG